MKVTIEEVRKALRNYAVKHQTDMETAATQLMGIGFCQPKFYKQAVWSKAKIVMLFLCQEMKEFVYYKPYHGRGHFWTYDKETLSTKEVDALLLEFLKAKI